MATKKKKADPVQKAVKPKKKAVRYDVISPDGFSTTPEGEYATRDEAKAHLRDWMKRYEQQGYYSSVNGRIPLEDLEDACEIVEIK